MNLMQRGMNMLATQMPAAAGGTINYCRNTDSVSLTATFGRSEFSVEDTNGVRVEYSDRDFIVAAASLILSDAVITPQRGDVIDIRNATTGEVLHAYEVLAPGNMQPYRYCDPERTLLRIHTKSVK